MPDTVSAATTGVTIPRGFRAAGVRAGIKRNGGLDLALIVSDRPAHGAAVFTINRAQAAPVLVSRDHLTKSGKKPAPAEGVRDKRVLTDGARTIEIHHIAGVLHDDGLLLVYLPKEKLLIEADAYTPPPPNTPPPSPPSPFTVGLVDNIGRLGLTVDRLLPLHGRIVPLADLNQAAGRAN